MPPVEGLPGIDSSIPFSPDPLHHLFIVIPGGGDPYVDHPPWMSSLENCLSFLSKNFNLVSDNLQKIIRHHNSSFTPPSVMFLPVEWHRPAFQTWQAELYQAQPDNSTNSLLPTVRSAVAETIGDILLPASPFWRSTIATHLFKQIQKQISAVRRNRPLFSGRVSLFAHSVGAVLAVELLQQKLEELDISLDAVVFTGCPLAAYAALAPGEDQKALVVIRKLRKEIRFFNLFHPLDPVAYRLEPFVLNEGDSLQPAIQVTPRKRTFWDDASLFWDDVVFNLWSTLFQGTERRPTQRDGRSSEGRVSGTGTVDLFSMFGGNQRGNASMDNEQLNDTIDEKKTNDLTKSPGHVMEGVKKRVEMRRTSSYVVLTPKKMRPVKSEMWDIKMTTDGSDGDGDDEKKMDIVEKNKEMEMKTDQKECIAGGSEVLLSNRIDYELRDGMGIPPLDVMASWGAIKAHTYYWQSMDVAQMLFDIAITCEDSMTQRGK